MAEKIRMFVIDVNNRKVDVELIEDNYLAFNNRIGCNCMDIAERNLNGKYYDFIVDDEGALVENPKPSCFNSKNGSMLFGTTLICLHDNEGNCVSLSDEDIENLKKNVRWVICTEFPLAYPVLVNVEY